MLESARGWGGRSATRGEEEGDAAGLGEEGAGEDAGHGHQQVVDVRRAQLQHPLHTWRQRAASKPHMRVKCAWRWAGSGRKDITRRESESETQEKEPRTDRKRRRADKEETRGERRRKADRGEAGCADRFDEGGDEGGGEGAAEEESVVVPDACVVPRPLEQRPVHHRRRQAPEEERERPCSRGPRSVLRGRVALGVLVPLELVAHGGAGPEGAAHRIGDPIPDEERAGHTPRAREGRTCLLRADAFAKSAKRVVH
eukprot:1252034-Rhodomonas_salina.3